MSREERQASHGPSPDPPLRPVTNVDEEKYNVKVKAKQRRTRQGLISLLPTKSDLHMILDTTSSWWNKWRLIFPEITASQVFSPQSEDKQTLKQHVLWAIDQASPVTVANGLICLGICIRQLHPGVDHGSFHLPRSPKDLMNHYLSVVELIIADDEYAGSLEGIELIILVAKTYVNLGQPRKGWLLFRRGVALAQLIGLHPSRNMLSGKAGDSPGRRENAWWSLYMVDRYVSLLLGLPYSFNDSPGTKEAAERSADPTELYQRMLAIIVGKIIDRNQTMSSPSLPSTLEIDQDLEDVSRFMTEDWWNTDDEQSATTISVGESFGRTAVQFWHYQTKALLHLPFMLQSATDRRFEYNRHACLDAARQMVRLYDKLRLDDDGAYFICKIMDFQVFTSVVLLLLGLLGYGGMSLTVETEEGDWQLIDATLRILRRASSTEPDDTMLVQAVEAIETLAAFRNEGSAGKGHRLGRSRKVVIPYFGTINISPGSRFSAPKSMSTSPGTSTHAVQSITSGSHPTPLGDGSTSNFLMPTFEYDPNVPYDSLPQIDIDWSNVANMDLDQDWNWAQMGLG